MSSEQPSLLPLGASLLNCRRDVIFILPSGSSRITVLINPSWGGPCVSFCTWVLTKKSRNRTLQRFIFDKVGFQRNLRIEDWGLKSSSSSKGYLSTSVTGNGYKK